MCILQQLAIFQSGFIPRYCMERLIRQSKLKQSVLTESDANIDIPNGQKQQISHSPSSI